MTATVLITGSSSGFGRGAVTRFLAEGWNVVATLRDPSRWDGEESESLLVQALDVRDDASVTAAVTAATERFGRLDVVVNNAGIGLFSVFEATPPSIVEDVFDTNVLGPMRVVRATLPVFSRQGGGRFVNLSSGNTTVPMPLQAVYSASKGALYNFSESLTHELAGQNVRVKVVEPGFVPTTNFFETTIGRFRTIPVPDSYATTVKATLDGFQVQPPPGYLATDDDVVEAILAAATEESDRLRIRVGGDSEDLGRARQQPDAEYDAWRREFFGAR
ncbi:SDR family oxidoreductase [Kineosporia mesophila]|uniref:SDR family oxidoreductase n=1 Tax=Kineosporia mesophila TaxID=566012 RepID=A0ABP6Z2N9_9ACTN|nr:SDR family NAD(P)-dependent oxidoreductase [Kineosporia mesophila]MCD5355206.1 SDR family NAD(P)-dependent oxidoreductase [Kineosporia mesophila]